MFADQEMIKNLNGLVFTVANISVPGLPTAGEIFNKEKISDIELSLNF